MFGKQNLQIFFNNNLFGETSKESVSIGKANSWFKYLIEIINKDSKKKSSGVTVFFEKLPWGSEVSLGNYLRLTDMLIGILSTYFIDLVRRKRSILWADVCPLEVLNWKQVFVSRQEYTYTWKIMNFFLLWYISIIITTNEKEELAKVRKLTSEFVLTSETLFSQLTYT